MTKKKVSKLTDGLNKEQTVAYKNITDWLGTISNDMWLLEGYAGTGKTFLLKRILLNALMRNPKNKIAVVAPTNKAVKVAKEICNIDSTKISFLTVHKLLGLKEKIMDDGRQVFERDSYIHGPDISSFSLVVVDETSMLNDDLYTELENYRNNVKILFIGDPAQIPPVGKEDSIPFDQATQASRGIKVVRLTEIMRQATENPIISHSMLIRNNLESFSPIKEYKTVYNTDKGIIYYNTNNIEDRGKLTPLLKELFDSDSFRLDPDHAKVIAWRNVTVESFNILIRTILYGKDAPKIIIGEKLIADKPIINKEEIVFSTNDEFQVISYEKKIREFGDPLNPVVLEYYYTVVEKEEEGIPVRKTIRILHENSEEDFELVLDGLKRKAIKERDKKIWKEYYNFLREFADVLPNLAITAHKSQGSTYKNVIIIEDDLDYNKNIVERNRIKYTAYTRPSTNLYILKRS